MSTHLELTRPDDWHVHFRDAEFLQQTVPATAQHFARALIMPNLKPALTSLLAIQQYRERILAAIPANNPFKPYMTFYLNESVEPQDLYQAASLDYILGAKLYPAGATTHSEAGVRSFKALYPMLEVMQDKDLVLQIHGEMAVGDIFEREALFIKEQLPLLIKNFPRLRFVLEHISTVAAVDFINQSSAKIAATITIHHLLYNRNQLLAGGIRPHYYCLPILKHEREQKALQQAACSGNPRFFAGTDSAPHAINQKETDCGCAGIYTAPYALPLYTDFFDRSNRLDKLNAFVAEYGATFYQLPINTQKIELVKNPELIPHRLSFGQDQVIPVAAGETLNWSVHDFS